MANGVLEQVGDLAARYDRRAREAAESMDYTVEAKAKTISKIYDEATQKAQELVEKEADRLEVNLRAARREINQPKLQGAKDSATLWLAYRDALKEAKAINTTSELREAYHAAELVGDDLKAQALVMTKALDLNDTKTLEDYLNSRGPEVKRDYMRYIEAVSDWNEWQRGSIFSGLSRFKKPSEYNLQNRA